MARLAGGLPRRSHTKSRRGCELCKRRHIRCDETFPQWYKTRCPYHDWPNPEDGTTPFKPDLMWTPDIVATINQWQSTGMFPFPTLQLHATPEPSQFSVDELRLIHHVASICNDMEVLGATNFTIWTRKIPAIISVGSTHRFVMEALLAFSATHLSSVTGCPAVSNMADEHQCSALQGLQKAIGTFSRETSDAVLAASVVLSWLATDWQSWDQLISGTTTIIQAMEHWKKESQLLEFIDEMENVSVAPKSPHRDQQSSQPHCRHTETLDRTIQRVREMKTYLKYRDDLKGIKRLLGFLELAKTAKDLPVAKQFDRLRPLRDWLFYLPVLFLQRTGGSPGSLIVITQYYTVAMLIERLFPRIGAAYFGSMSVRPLEDIARHLLSISLDRSTINHQATLRAVEALVSTVDVFGSRMACGQAPFFSSFNTPASSNTSESLPLNTVAAGTISYSNSLTFGYEHEPRLLPNPEYIPSEPITHLPIPSLRTATDSQSIGDSSSSCSSYSPCLFTLEECFTSNDSELYGSLNIGDVFDGATGCESGENRGEFCT